MSDEEYTAKLFKNGGSQAVRLPKALRLPGTEVRVRRQGRGVLLEPVEGPEEGDFWERLDALGPLGNDFDIGDRSSPPEPHRDAVVDEFTAWLNERHPGREA